MTKDYQVQIKDRIIKNDLYYKKTLLLSYSIQYPQFSSDRFRMTLNRMNQYYEMKAIAFKMYCEHKLFKLAIEQYENAIKNGFPVRKFEALVVYQVTYNQNCSISLHFDQYEFTGGAHGNTVRNSDTWNLQKGTKIKLGHLFTNKNYKDYIIMTINQKIAEQIRNGTNQYFENYKQLVTENFNENHFYLTPKGVVIYYQQYEIAPYSSGIPTFMIPYSSGNAAEPKCW